MAVAAVAATTLLVYPLKEVAPVVALGVVYLVAVLLVSSVWGAVLGLGTAVLSALAFNFFHLPPTGGFTVAEGENWVALAVFFVAAIVASQLAEEARRRAADAERGRREADLAAEMARLLLGGTSVDDSLRAVGQRIAQAFELLVGVDRAGLGHCRRTDPGAAGAGGGLAGRDPGGAGGDRRRHRRGPERPGGARAWRRCSGRHGSARGWRPRWWRPRRCGARTW